MSIAETVNDSPYAAKPWLKHYDFWVDPNPNMPRQPLYQILQIASASYRDKPATAFLGAFLTFGEVKSQVDRLATALAKLGIAKGDRVGIMLPNCPQYLISFFAIVRLGAIVANVNPIYTPREVEAVAKDSGMKAMIVLCRPSFEPMREVTSVAGSSVTPKRFLTYLAAAALNSGVPPKGGYL